jgi:hypothetical protein
MCVMCADVCVCVCVRHVCWGVLFAVEEPELYFVRSIVCLAVIITAAYITMNQDQRARLYGVINLWFSVQKKFCSHRSSSQTVRSDRSVKSVVSPVRERLVSACCHLIVHLSRRFVELIGDTAEGTDRHLNDFCNMLCCSGALLC